MKFRLMLASIVAVTASLSFAESAEEEDAAASTNLVGVLRPQLPSSTANKKSLLLCVPWTEGDNDSSNSVAQIVKTAAGDDLQNGDMLRVFKGDTKEYVNWSYNGETKKWDPAGNVDKKGSGQSPDPGEYYVSLGDAIRIDRNRDTNLGNLFLCGRAPAFDKISVKSTFTGSGLFLFAPPKVVKGMSIKDVPTLWDWENLSEGDEIRVQASNGLLVAVRYKSSAWTPANARYGTLKMLPGSGIWFQHQADNAVTATFKSEE